ncbi:DNA-binding LacI/PurR family transcriptional regulator [Rhodococcus sp. SORGH_AS303]|nr:DNA-binding LacI/PurR family transcriptional regulator [Rhodococcus sp. SORGH_AS_0303]
MSTPPRSRKTTMSDVAALAGVSRTLVSFVLSGKPGASDDTRDRVLAAARELDYRPDNAARLLARGRSRTLGVVIDVRQPFQADLVTHIYPVAEAAGYEVLLSASAPGRDETKAIEALLSHRCEGVILLGPSSSPEYVAHLEERAVVVMIGRALPATDFDIVRSADDHGVRQAVDHLVGLGHVDIHHVDGGTDSGATERRAAFRAAMDERGLPAVVWPGAHTEEAGSAAGTRMVAERRVPTAVMAGNDLCAVGLMDAFHRAGIAVPDDVSVVGYDDSELAHLSRIDLTTVRQDAEGLAATAVRFAIARLEDESLAPAELVVEPSLVVRGSTGPVRTVARQTARRT